MGTPSQSKSTALQSLPSALLGRPQPSQSVIVLSSQFHSLLPHSLSCTVFLAPRFSQFNPYSVRFRSVSVKVDRAAVAALLQSEATAFAVSHRTVLAVPLVVVHSASRPRFPQLGPAFLSIPSLLGLFIR